MTNPLIPGKAINLSTLDERFEKTLEELSNADVANVQKIVASQLDIMRVYHSLVQEQAKKSFFWALIAAAIGLIFFVGAVSFVLVVRIENAAVVSMISGALVEFISGINFYLYATTSSQLAEFHSRLDITQRFLLANSICESLEGDVKQQTRAKLVETISDVASQKVDTTGATK